MSAFGVRADIVPISSNVRLFLDEMLGGSFCRKYVVSIPKGEQLRSVVSRGDLIQAFISLAVTLLLMAVALFLSAGTLQWAHGLWFMAAFLSLTLVAMAWLWRVNPEIFVARRQLTGRGTKGWDLMLLFILLAASSPS